MSKRDSVKINLYFPLLTLLGVVLIVMKLGGVMPVAAWSWWIVTLPFWISWVIAFVWIAVVALFVGLFALIAYLLDR